MQNEPDAQDNAANDAAAAGELPASAGRRRLATWLAMGSVAVAILALIFSPDPSVNELPPPSAPGGISAAGEEAAGSTLSGKPAPDFTLKDMNGADVTLTSFKGKVVLLNFWATWCGPCRQEIPALVELQAQYADDLVVLGLSVDDPVEKLLPYAEEYRMNYPVLVGNGREDVQDAFGPIWGIPITVFIGRDGTIHKKHNGIATKEQFEEEIKALL
jgi:cytochrome c biogenesis protein CcmG/thiol:disulfide interchange protein DsbE